MYNPKSLTHISRDNNRLDDKQFNEELAKKMINPYYFTDRNLIESKLIWIVIKSIMLILK